MGIAAGGMGQAWNLLNVLQQLYFMHLINLDFPISVMKQAKALKEFGLYFGFLEGSDTKAKKKYKLNLVIENVVDSLAKQKISPLALFNQIPLMAVFVIGVSLYLILRALEKASEKMRKKNLSSKFRYAFWL